MRVALRAIRQLDPGVRFNEANQAVIASLLVHSQLNEFAEFESELGKLNGGSLMSSSRSLWIDMINVRNGSQYAESLVELPAPSKPSLEDQTALLQDNTRQTTITVRGKALGAGGWSAFLTIKSKGRKYPFPASASRIKAGGRELEFTFPSVSAWRLDEAAKDPANLELVVEGPIDVPKDDYPCRYIRLPQPDDKAAVEFTPKSKQIVVKDGGEGSLQVHFVINDANTGDPLTFSIDAALKPETKFTDVTDADGANGAVLVKVAGKDRYAVQKAGTVRLILENLEAGNSVMLTGRQGETVIQGPQKIDVKGK